VCQLLVVPLLFLRAIRRLRLAVHAALPSLLRIGCRHPGSREENEDLILDQRGISFNTLRGLEVNVRIVCFGGGDIHRTVYNRAGALLSLEAQRKTPGVATRMRREGVLTDFIVIHLWIR
jgi:hypothetical protein